MRRKMYIMAGFLLVFVLIGAGCQKENALSGNVVSNEEDTNEVNTTSQDQVPNSSTGVAETDNSASDTVVRIDNFTFVPSEVTVKNGSTITFVNEDSMQHTATANNGVFDTGLIANGESKSVTLNDVGTFSYHCTPHPVMKGKITVEE